MANKRVPWSEDEDAELKQDFLTVNGVFPSYQSQADYLNKTYHGGRKVRSVAAVRRRDGHVNYGKPWGRK